MLTQENAEKMGMQPGQQRVKITEVNRASVICQTVKVNLWHQGEK